MSTPQERLAIIVTAFGAVMGSLVETEDGFFLKRPRAMAVTPDGHGSVRLQLSEMIGKPDQVVITGDLTYWIVTDQTIVSTYLESISPIKIARTLPPRQTIN